jgi:D-alanyl-D-alanine carboxypeptidase (penicillin-binding protein 5/6)
MDGADVRGRTPARRALAAALAALALVGPAHAEGRAPVDAFRGAAAAYLVIADGEPLWAASPERRLPPASLAKLMTALVVVEAGDPDAIVAVSARAARAGGARMGLAAGTRIAVSELLAGLLIRSANDACLALAEFVAGTETRFVARMNALAAEWGLADTRFANACGFDAPGQHASARDVAVLAQRVLAAPALAKLVAQPRHTARSADGRAYPLVSTNLLLGLVPGLKGVKTGYTERAGRCLVGYAERDGHRVLVVLLGANDRWWDAVAMFEQAFARAPAAPRPRGG